MYSPSASENLSSRNNTNSQNTQDSARLLSNDSNNQRNYSTDDNNNNSNGENNNNNSNDSWMLDKPTLRFAAVMLVICLGLTIGFSVQANKAYEDSKNSNSTNGGGNHGHETPAPAAPTPAPTPVPKPKYDHGGCSVMRNFTMWKSFPVVRNNKTQTRKEKCVDELKLVRGEPAPCKSDSDCQLGIPSYCVYGDTNLLRCHRGFCALETFSIPVSFHKPGSGVCPLNSTSFYQNASQATPDSCADLLLSLGTNPVSVLDVATKPVICATKNECGSGTKIFPGGIRCEPLMPIE